jgi:DNA mismatch repair ATPase MutS
MIRIFLTLNILLWSIAVFSQSDREKYLETITSRSQKIIQSAELQHLTSSDILLNELVNFYDKINTNAEKYEKKLAALKSEPNAKQLEIDKIKMESDSQAKRIYSSFLKNISEHANNQQIEALVDGVTYGLLNRTYNAYLDMIPQLKAEEKKMIKDMLLEARDLAVIASDSKERHAAFGKYKGRINNYLSKEGYDLKKEGDKWKERINKQS